MNKTVILIHLIITSSLQNPIDEIIISRDVTNPEIILKIDDGKPVLFNVDDMITRREVNQKNMIYSVLKRLKGIEEEEDATTFTTTTTNFEMDGISGDDIEDSTDSSIEFNPSRNTEEEFESNIPNDEYNAEWDLFDDTISTRRMMNNLEELSEEIKEFTFTDSNHNFPEVKYHRASGVEEKQRSETGDYLENIQNQKNIELAHKTSEIKKGREYKNKHLESIQNYNVEGGNERRASAITKEEKQQVERMRLSNPDRGRNFDKKYGIQRIPFIYPSPSEIQRYNKPSIPIHTINAENFNIYYKIHRISPVTIQDFEHYSSKPYYRKYKPVVSAQKSMIINIISKLAEATRNSFKFAAGNEYFNDKQPFTNFPNVHKNMYVPSY